MYLGKVNKYSRTKLAGSFLSKYFHCVCAKYGDFLESQKTKGLFPKKLNCFLCCSMDFAARDGSNRKFHLGLIEGGYLE